MPRAAVEAFLSAVARGPDEIAARLETGVVYRAADLPVLTGRLAVQRLWRRLFQTYGAASIVPTLMIQDADIVIVRQTQTFGSGAGAFELAGTAVYGVRDGRVAYWRDCFDLRDLPGADRDLWPRLWRARW